MNPAVGVTVRRPVELTLAVTDVGNAVKVWAPVVAFVVTPPLNGVRQGVRGLRVGADELDGIGLIRADDGVLGADRSEDRSFVLGVRSTARSDALGTTFTWNVCEALVSVAVGGRHGDGVSTAGVALLVSMWIAVGVGVERVAEVMVIGLRGLSCCLADLRHLLSAAPPRRAGRRSCA